MMGGSIAKAFRKAFRVARRLSLPVRLALPNRIARSSEPLKPAVALLGNGRSGTSWIGRMLGTARNVAYYREPCHPKFAYRNDDSVWSRYVPIDGDDSHFRRCLDHAFSGRFINEDGVSDEALSLRRTGAYRVIVKEVACFLSVEWVYQQWQPQIVLVVRHPCASVMSVQNLGLARAETRRYRDIISNPLLRDGVLAPLSRHLETLTTPIEISAAIWAIKNRVACDAHQRHPEWIVIRYEDFCKEPVDSFRRLYGKLGLAWTADVEAAIRSSSMNEVTGPHATSRVSSTHAERWREACSMEDIDTVRKVVEPFELPFYQLSSDWVVSDREKVARLDGA